MNISIKDIIEFFDNSVNRKNSKYSNAITILLGEEFSSYCFKLYREQEGDQVTIHDIPCKKPGRAGKQLDRWIQVNNHENNYMTLYQTEIKTWNSNGIGGSPIPNDANIQEINKYGLKEWNNIWDSNNNKFKHDQINKVLLKMTPQQVINKFDCHKALLIYWLPIFNKEISSIKDGIIFEQNSGNGEMENVTIFSVSMYLRYLYDVKNIKNITLPNEHFPKLKGTLENLDKILIKNV